MLKKYKEFLLESGLDLGGLSGDTKEEKPVDPDEEIAKEKEKKKKIARKERVEELDKAKSIIEKAIEKTPSDFRNKFKKRIFDAMEDDDRVKYHDLILDIQSFEIPMSRNQESAEIDTISPIIKELQILNKNEYRG